MKSALRVLWLAVWCVYAAHGEANKGTVTDIGAEPWPGPQPQPKVVYGTDDRVDIYQVSDPLRLSQVAATCALMYSSKLQAQSGGGYTLVTSAYREFGVAACADEPFGSQPVAAFCTGFLVGDDIVATAGHCLDTAQLGSVRFVFGFVMENGSTPVTSVSAAQVYTAVEILGRQNEGDYDYTIARLDRAVDLPGVEPLAIRRDGSIGVNEPVGVIGHPAGLPMKVSFGANTAVRSSDSPGYFVANTDTYGGNSGSPVFNAVTGLVEGILVRGETDFQLGDGCFRSYTVGNTQGRGEDVSKTTSFAQYVPEILSNLGELTLSAPAVKCGGTLTATVRDRGLIGGSATLTITTDTGDQETLAGIDEDPVHPGEFPVLVGAQIAAPQPNNGAIEGADGSVITFTYRDANTGSGPGDVVRTATLDCTSPAPAFGVAVNYLGSAQATVVYSAAEPVTPTIRFGTNCSALSLSSAGVRASSGVVTLNNLIGGTTYYYQLDVRDDAGNVATTGDGAGCLSFTTATRTDYLSKLFTTDANTLALHRLRFTPTPSENGYILCVEPAASFETSQTGAEELVLEDDGVATLTLGQDRTVPFFGATYGTVYVCANGFVTFDAADNAYSESLQTHFAHKRVSGLFHDLSPHLRGKITWRQTIDRLAVTYLDVPEYVAGASPLPSNTQSFQIELFFDGTIQLTYLAVSATKALVGLSNGLQLPADFEASNLLGYANCDTGDTDNDGMPDAWELRAGLRADVGTGMDGPAADPDGDGLTNAEEYAQRTHPLVADSDRDGVEDGAEVTAGTDPTGSGQAHDADTDGNFAISLQELLRLVQFYNTQGYHCEAGTEDGYGPAPGAETCRRHQADYADPAYRISLGELLRLIQFYNLGGYTRDVYTEDGFAGAAG